MVIFLTPDYHYLRSINGEDLKSSAIIIKVKLSKHLLSASFESFPTLF